jgi:hypothetical protein
MSPCFLLISCEDGSGNGYQDAANSDTRKRSPVARSVQANEQSWRRYDQPQLALDAIGNTVLVATETLDLSVRPKDDSDTMRIRW